VLVDGGAGAGAVGGAGVGGSGGRGGRGGTGGNALGGAGAGNDGKAGTCEQDAGWAGDKTYDPCCLGDAYGNSFEYYATDSPACGKPRTCDVVLAYNYCQDAPRGVQHVAKCCDDGRWHVVSGDLQLEDTVADPEESQLSPPCGGMVRHSSHALHFDGASYLELPLTYSPHEVIFEIWFRTTAPSGPLLASQSTPHRLYLSGGKLCFSPSEDGSDLCTGETSFADGAWHHAAMSAGSLVKYREDDIAYGGLYADGTLRVPGTPAGFSASIDALRAGYGPLDDPGVSVYFVGDLDEIRIWSNQRHPYEILDFYATGLTGERTMARLLGYFPLEESDVTTTSKNLALDIHYDCNGFPEEGAGGAGPELPDATLVGFGSGTSPWIAPGAF
jgi:hypothetical protein